MADANVLIIGVTGLVGSSMAIAMARAGCFVCGIARSELYVPGEHIRVRCNRRSAPAALDEAIRACGAPSQWTMVIDCCFESPADLESLQAVRAERIVVMSSGSVYDHRQSLPINEHGQLVSDPLSAISFGSWARQLERRLADEAVQAWTSHAGIPLTLLRLGVVLGVGDRSNRLGWWSCKAGGSEPLVVPSDARLSFVDARDVAAFVATGLRARQMHGVFNISGHSITLSQVVAEICSASGVARRMDLLPSDSLIRNGAVPWAGVQLWAAPGTAAEKLLHPLDCRKAEAAGFTRRPWSDTIVDACQAARDGRP